MIESFKTLSLPPLSAEQIFVVALNRAFFIDIQNQRVLGMIDLGYVGNIVISADAQYVYAVESFYSRGTRGKRTDVVTLYDMKNLSVVDEIEIPPKRFLCVIKKYTQALSNDGRFLLVCNITPASSVTVVDLHKKKFVREIATPGYVLLYPYESRRFAMFGQEGSLLLFSLNDEGHLQQKNRIPAGFSLNDPLFEHGVYLKRTNRYCFISYEGRIKLLQLSGPTAQWEKSWDITQGSDYRPCGWQLLSCDSLENNLYILMHKAGKDKHKESGKEVWVVDLVDQKVSRKIELERPVDSIHIVGKEKTYLCGLNHKGYLDIYDLQKVGRTAFIEELGEGAFLLLSYEF
ncbi:methylamine dehydrogenase [Methylacidiphilum caldifontis]|uniref:Methylamine dehydrogenase n=1 Tax=Methylacidiphilum caldifontis TaxID=2795386 RepID=A0A4Y8PG62_9BACT|nr:methylamine dehydrogenase [Methylacidiphilum caldifontis]